MIKDQKYQFIKGEDGKVSIAGLGSYGKVKLARNSETKEIVAIKMIFKNAKQEIDVHHKLNHPNIIKLLNYNYDKQKEVTYMILQYAESGTLSDKIKFGLGQLSKKLVRKYFRDVCQAVKYLHNNNYMHRDIKPENILLTKDQRAKLCDFGFAALCEYRSTLCGTYEYMSPEMIQKKPYDHKIDVWALGILLFQMINGTAPFRGDSGQQVIAQMKKPLLFSSRFQPQEIDLIKKILRVNADKRPTIQQILHHSYFDIALDQNELQGTFSMAKSDKVAQVVQKVEQQSFRKRNNTLNNESTIENEKKASETGLKLYLNDFQKSFKPYVPKTPLDSKGIVKLGNFSGGFNNLSNQRNNISVQLNNFGSNQQQNYSSSNISIRKNQSIGNVGSLKSYTQTSLDISYGNKINPVSQISTMNNYKYQSEPVNPINVQPQSIYNNYPPINQSYQMTVNNVGRPQFVNQNMTPSQNGSIQSKDVNAYINSFGRKIN